MGLSVRATRCISDLPPVPCRMPEPPEPSPEIRVNSSIAYKTVGARNLSFWLVKQDDQPCYVLIVSTCVDYDSYRGNSHPSRALGR